MGFKKLIVGAICFLMAAPTAATLVGAGDCLPIEENRLRAGFPDIQELKDSENPYRLVEQWYNDRFGLRDLLIRTQHQIDYTVFHYNPDLYLAEDNYLVYRRIVVNEQVANEMLNEEEIARVVGIWERIGDSLSERGIACKFIIPPQKNQVLVAETADIPVARPEPGFHERLEAAFAAGPTSRWYVPVLEVLREKNAVLPVFYRSDFHWNDWGTAVGFGEAINSYAADLGLGEIYHTEDLLQLPVENYPGGQLNNLSLLRPVRFDEYTAGLLESHMVLTEDSKGHGIDRWENQGDFLFDGAVFFIGDSYAHPVLHGFNGTNSGIPDLFRTAYFCHWDNSADVLNRLPEDVQLVVIEKIEASISYTMDVVEGVLGEKQK